MKTFRFIYQFVLLLMCTTACNEYDDSELWDRVNSLDDRVTSIENQLKALNNDITSISALVGALQNRLYLTNVTTLGDGYTLTFSDGSHITVSDGKDGINGKDAPVINVRYYNGRYYWVQTINGETTWLNDSDGNKIPASGTDAITPLLKVDSDGYWIISYDKGYTYSKLLDEYGKAVKASGMDGDSFFESVEATEDELRLILKDGTEIVIPLGEQSLYKAVNLGLSVRWASFNLGAITSSEKGGYFLWGDVDNVGVMPDYQAPNIDNICGSKYDIARAMWGGSWRLPNKAEQIDLIKKCTWTRATINGVSGMKVTGSNGNSIFLPSTGYMLPASGPAGATQLVDENSGYYWVGESYGDTYGRFGYVFYYNSTSYYYNASLNASMIKMAIRPVKE